MKKIIILLGGLGLIVAISCTKKGINQGLEELPELVDFNFHIKPILSDRCFACHGPDENKRSAGLRLDTPEGAFAKLESGGHAIVRGKPGKSKILHRMHSQDPELMMPPPESKLNITSYETALIEKWIKQGAEYKKHWSFIPPQKRKLPKIENEAWVANEIDQFILAKIEQAGLKASVEAPKEALIRRLSFDLRGLPPSLEEIDAFLKDKTENAYEKLVDQFLASEAFGERMTSDWLAVSRYGDTHGYEADSKRMAWQWRDWVIKAFNENMPYDEFITAQIAGDLLEEPSRDQLIATSFNRNHLMNSENGIIDEEWRVEYVSDRTNTAGKAFMGLTMECAKCHDHKYDPISQKEYFSLFAFFNNVDEPGQIRFESQAYPLLDLTSESQQNKLEELDELTDQQRKAISKYIQELKTQPDWKGSVNTDQLDLNKGLKIHLPFDKVIPRKEGKVFINKADAQRPVSLNIGEEKFVEGHQGNAFAYDGINQTVFKDGKNAFDINEAFSYSLWLSFPEPFSMARILGTEDGNFDLVPGYYLYIEDDKIAFQLSSTWDYNYIKVKTQKSFPFKKWTHLTLSYDGSAQASGLKIYIDGEEQELTVLKDNLTKTIARYASWFKVGHYSLEGGAIDEFRQYDRVLTLPEIQQLAGKEITEEAWFDYYVHNKDQKLQSMRDTLRLTLGKRLSLLDTIPQLMVMKDLQDSIRPTYVLNRGVYDDRGEEVFATTPEAVMSFPEDLPKNRRGLAAWFFAKENPLTSRVMINRLWQLVFGTGIVNTPDDFGSQGSLPSHPELLDWLAVDFQENHWDMKLMIKKMVMSATYRQSSTISPELLEKDPSNELLARGVRYRMPAEMLRDNALAISGLLVNKIGGEPVKPYQPAGIWAQISSTKIPYVQDHGEKLYRRSLYTYWKRAAPPPNMLTLDAPSRHTCTVKREATSTPLQALILLNDIQFVEAARVFAQNLLKENKDHKKTLEKAFRMATSRLPDKEEVETLLSLWEESKAAFQAQPVDAEELVNFGEFPVDTALDNLELAAFTMVTSAILNLNESITKS